MSTVFILQICGKMAQPPLYPSLTPLLVDPAWFLVDKPVDLDKELKVCYFLVLLMDVD